MRACRAAAPRNNGIATAAQLPPTVALRDAALSGDGDLARAAEKLFPATGTDDSNA